MVEPVCYTQRDSTEAVCGVPEQLERLIALRLNRQGMCQVPSSALSHPLSLIISDRTI